MFYRLFARYPRPGPNAEWEICNHELDSPVAQHNLKHDTFPDFQPELQPVLLSRSSSLVNFVDATGVVPRKEQLRRSLGMALRAAVVAIPPPHTVVG